MPDDAPTHGLPADDLAADPVPDRVGRYEVVGEIARGGMGVVYRARDPGLSREVAVKVVRGHYRTSPAAIRRFLDEATITGQLQHPGIPPVFEVGELADGSPFLAMKLIKGRTLEAILGDTPYSAAEHGRFLAVFEHVCQAVAYAHARDVIHRDLKPGNVMVGAFGEVQVMDWGLAKVLASGGRESAVPSDESTLGTEIHSVRDADQATRAGSLLGTPEFMSPEQALGAVGEIDERSDVFGLGAVLCVILTGRPPFAAGDPESTRLRAARSELGEAFAALNACGAEPDLVALCKRCLAVNRDDRPADSGAVAVAVARLRAEAEDRARQAELATAAATVRAAEERKRRRVVAGAAAAVGVVLAVGAGLSGWQMVRANTAADRAGVEASNARTAEGKAVEREQAEKAARETAEAVSGFMQEVFAQGSPDGQASNARGVKRDLTVKEAMDFAARHIAARFRGRPDLEAAVRTAVGTTYLELAKHREAEEQLKLALAACETAHGPDHLHTLSCINNLAAAYEAAGDLRAAEPLHRRALAAKERTLGPDHPSTLIGVSNLAVLLYKKKDYAAAGPLLRRVLDWREAALGPDHPDTLAGVNNLAGLYYATRDYPAAGPLLERAIGWQERVNGPDHPDTLRVVANLASLREATGDYPAAELLFRRALTGYEKIYEPDHPSTLANAYSLAGVYSVRKKYADAVPLLERAVRGYAKSPDRAGIVPFVRSQLGLALLAAGRPADAEPHLLAGYDALAKEEDLGPPLRARLRQVAQGLVEVYAATNRPAEAADWRGKVAALRPEVAPPPRSAD